MGTPEANNEGPQTSRERHGKALGPHGAVTSSSSQSVCQAQPHLRSTGPLQDWDRGDPKCKPPTLAEWALHLLPKLLRLPVGTYVMIPIVWSRMLSLTRDSEALPQRYNSKQLQGPALGVQVLHQKAG